MFEGTLDSGCHNSRVLDPSSSLQPPGLLFAAQPLSIYLSIYLLMYDVFDRHQSVTEVRATAEDMLETETNACETKENGNTCW